MSDSGLRPTPILQAIVLLACLAGSLGLAAAARSASAAPDLDVARSCAAASSLRPDARVAIVDSGISRRALPSGTVVGDRVDRTGDPAGPLAAHGTEMASILAASAPEAALVDIRVLGPDGSASTAAVAEGIDAARRAGAGVINLSAAVPATDDAIRVAIGRATASGVVVVIAAGNEARDLGRDPSWRSLAADPCTIVVGALGVDGQPLRSSNHGDGVVEVWVEGEDVAARDLDGRPIEVTGTSPAAASVSARLVGG